jgi:hypothetical protein
MPTKQQQSVSPAQPEDDAAKLALVNEFDKVHDLRRGIAKLGEEIEEWAGIPMPLDYQELVIEKTYNKAMRQALGLVESQMKKEAPTQAAAEFEAAGYKVRNIFYSSKFRCDIAIMQHALNGHITYGLIPAVHGVAFLLQTLGASEAWGIEQEMKARQLLATLIPHHAFKKYLLTGAFLETSKRTGILYVFRSLRPTVAIRILPEENDTKILAALCMHPIGYYKSSWAGAMCPTDDLIAHLMLMRADEPMFWKRATQHKAWRPEAGL